MASSVMQRAPERPTHRLMHLQVAGDDAINLCYVSSVVEPRGSATALGVMTSRKRFPVASNPEKPGRYPADVSSGGGLVLSAWPSILNRPMTSDHGRLE
jgi:hypothetical protein